jgi:hypothetical protein
MSLPLKKAQEEYKHALAHLRDALISVTRMRFDADAAAGAIPGVVSEAAYLLNVGRHDMLRVLLDMHDECVEAQVNLDIAQQSAKYEHNLDPEGEPAYLAEDAEPAVIRLSEWEYEKVLAGEPSALGTGWAPEVVRLPREE